MRWFDSRWPAIWLWPFSQIYAFVMDVRNILYDLGVLASYRVNSCVICVGNISVGGTGKTPTVIWLANELLGKYNVAILSRGYGRNSRGTLVVSDGTRVCATPREAGDEPFLIAHACPRAIVVVDEQRVRGAQFLVESFKPDVIILDDSFQHQRLRRDLNIVTLRANRPFGNRFCLPAGPLREPLRHLKRADMLLVIGEGEEAIAELASLKKPVFLAHYGIDQIVNQSQKALSTQKLKGRKVFAFCGLAHPDGFRALLLELQVNLLDFISFKDHYFYSQSDIDFIKNKASFVSAQIILTTEKDWVKVKQHQVPENWYVIKIKSNPKNPQQIVSRIEKLIL